MSRLIWNVKTHLLSSLPLTPYAISLSPFLATSRIFCRRRCVRVENRVLRAHTTLRKIIYTCTRRTSARDECVHVNMYMSYMSCRCDGSYLARSPLRSAALPYYASRYALFTCISFLSFYRRSVCHQRISSVWVLDISLNLFQDLISHIRIVHSDLAK